MKPIEIEKKVIEIIEYYSLYERTELTDKMYQFDWVDLENTVIELEDKFNIYISDNDRDNFETVGDIVKFVQKKYNEKEV